LAKGEITFLELINTIERGGSLDDIDGLAYIDQGKTVVNKERKFANLAELPVLDFSFIDPGKYMTSYIECRKMLHLYASKGCPCQCFFLL
jgi:radical SAM superfamily enzyme YgiQ (UPF0313 family)